MHTTKTLALVFVLLSAWSAIAQPFWLPKNSPHPFRYVDGKYYDLTPLFKYYQLPVSDRIAEVRGGRLTGKKAVPNPMPDWVYFNTPKVFSIHPEGILISEGDQVSYLKNFPGSSKLTDGEYISFTAMRVGSHKYKTVKGSIATVPAYDYGIPYDPKKKGEDGKAKLLPVE